MGEMKDFRLEPLTFTRDKQGKMTLKDILRTSDLHYSFSYGVPKTDEYGRKWAVKDHRIPDRIQPDMVQVERELGKGETFRASAGTTKDLPLAGWGGFRPKRECGASTNEPRYVVREGPEIMPGYTGYRPEKFN